MKKTGKVYLLVGILAMLYSSEVLAAGKCTRFFSEVKSHKTHELGPLVEWDRITPGQTHFARHIVENYDFKKPVKFIETTDSRILDKNIPVIEVRTAEDIFYMMVDNHHTLLRFVRSFQEKSDKKILVPIEVIEVVQAPKLDHRVMFSLVERGVAWSGQPITTQWRFKRDWPQNILQLQDMPMRSVAQLIFFEMNLSGKSFLPYVQFNLAEALRQRGFGFTSNDFSSAKRETKLKKKALRFIVETPELLQMLKDNVIAEDSKGAADKLRTYGKNKKSQH